MDANRVVGVSLRGGLGNRLFVAAAAFGQAAATGRQPAIFHAEPSAHSGTTYLDSVFAAFPRRPLPSPNDVDVRWERLNRCLCYDPVVPTDDRPIFLRGYYQNERYLAGQRDAFLRVLRWPALEAHEVPPEGTLFLHVRRGDYLGTPMHCVDLTLYYRRALALARQTFGDRLRRVLVFSDDPGWCRAHLSDLGVGNREVDVVDSSDEVRALVRMASCDLGGVCVNSSFSWWGAYLGYAPGKLVAFPDVWFNHPPDSAHPGDFADDVAFSGSVRVRVK